VGHRLDVEDESWRHWRWRGARGANGRRSAALGREDPARQVAVAAIAGDEHDCRVPHLIGDAKRNRACAAGRYADEYPFLAREAPRHGFSVRLRDAFDAIDPISIEDFRHVRLRPLAYAGNLRAFIGLAPDDHDGRVLLLQIPRYTHDRAGRAHAGHEMRDAAAGIAPDFRAGSLVVRERIVRIGELVEDDALAIVPHALGNVACGLHAAGLWGQHDFGAERAHRLPPLERQMLGHHQDHA